MAELRPIKVRLELDEGSLDNLSDELLDRLAEKLAPRVRAHLLRTARATGVGLS